MLIFEVISRICVIFLTIEAGLLEPENSYFKKNLLCCPHVQYSFLHGGSNLGGVTDYCRVDRKGTGASCPRGGSARDFVNFRKKISCIARARRGRAGLTVYPPWIQIRDVAATSSQSCDRKSKFGLRHAIKLT
jgi:hypothetical protein